MSGESELRKVLERIDSEYYAAQLVQSGFVEGVSKHKFISARYSRIGKLNDRLTCIVGDEEKALDMTVRAMEGKVVQ